MVCINRIKHLAERPIIVGLAFTERESAIIDRALAEVRAKCDLMGPHSDSTALTVICAEWLDAQKGVQ